MQKNWKTLKPSLPNKSAKDHTHPPHFQIYHVTIAVCWLSLGERHPAGWQDKSFPVYSTLCLRRVYSGSEAGRSYAVHKYFIFQIYQTHLAKWKKWDGPPADFRRHLAPSFVHCAITIAALVFCFPSKHLRVS